MKIEFPEGLEPFDPSQKLQNLISFIEREIDDEIILEISHEYNSYPFTAFYSDVDGKITIKIASKLLSDKEDLEQSLAHELGHVLLSKIYRYPSLSIDKDASEEIKREINLVRNSIEDTIINLILSEKYGISPYGVAFYTSINSEIDNLKNDYDPYDQFDSNFRDSFIFSRILLAIGYFHYIESEVEKRSKLQEYLKTMSNKFPEHYEYAEKCLFINDTKSIINKSGFKESMKLALTRKNLIQYVNFEETKIS